MPAFDRAEMDEMIVRWLEANRLAEENKDWSQIGSFYTADANYGWVSGPDNETLVVGRDEIQRVVLGVAMEGFDEDEWTYPYPRILVDSKIGEVVGFWRQVAGGVRRPDGTLYEVAGLGGSWMRYAGDFKWSWQRDFFDYANMQSLFAEMAANGDLPPGLSKMMSQRKNDPNPERPPWSFARGQSPIPQWPED